MIEPVEASDVLAVVDERGHPAVVCDFSGCPTMLHVARPRTRLDVIADAILDAGAFTWRALEWAALGLVLYGLFFYP